MRIIDLSGERFGRWMVKGRSTENKANRPAWDCLCDCGNTAVVRGGDLRNGSSTSCGCLTVETTAKRSLKHGGCRNKKKTRLYHCWVSMRQRARVRTERGDVCSVDEAWDDFANFEEWSLKNGYTDDKVLCRNGDVGDYSPENSRWDTQQNNVDECIANNKPEHIGTIFSKYAFKSPDGVVYTGANIKKFCRDMNINCAGMYDLHRGKSNSNHGWTKAE